MSKTKGNGMEFELSSTEFKEALSYYLFKKLFGKKRGKGAKSPIKEKDIEHIYFNKNNGSIIIKFVSSKT
jgi:hypothetical protein